MRIGRRHRARRIQPGESARRLAVAGQGLTRLGLFHVAADIASGALAPVLQTFNSGDVEEIHAVYIDHGGRLPARVLTFIDLLVEAVDLSRFGTSASSPTSGAAAPSRYDAEVQPRTIQS